MDEADVRRAKQGKPGAGRTERALIIVVGTMTEVRHSGWAFVTLQQQEVQFLL